MLHCTAKRHSGDDIRERCRGPDRRSASQRFPGSGTARACPAWPGFTLLELLIVLSLAALLALASIPLLSSAQHSIQSSQLQQLTGFLKLARSQAVSLGRRVTLCGSIDGEQCSAEWSEAHSVMLFLDANGNHRLDSGERLLLEDNSLGGRWHWRGSGLRSYMRFGPMGQAVDFGSFYLCPAKPDEDGRRLRINAAGRSYRDTVSRKELDASGICP